MTAFERDVRAAVYQRFRHLCEGPSIDELTAAVGATRAEVGGALRALAAAHALVLGADGQSIWMAHPFSGVPTDDVVSMGGRRWFANCVWDGLSIVGLLGGTGRLETCSPATGAAITFEVVNGVVSGEGLVHYLVPASRFWDDIGFT